MTRDTCVKHQRPSAQDEEAASIAVQGGLSDTLGLRGPREKYRTVERASEIFFFAAMPAMPGPHKGVKRPGPTAAAAPPLIAVLRRRVAAVEDPGAHAESLQVAAYRCRLALPPDEARLRAACPTPPRRRRLVPSQAISSPRTRRWAARTSHPTGCGPTTTRACPSSSSRRRTGQGERRAERGAT